MMKGKRILGSVVVLVLLLTLVVVGVVQAGGYNLTAVNATATINGAIFRVFNPDDPTGSGFFNPFVRISSNLTVIKGYNTSYRPLQFQENNSGQFTKSELLSTVPWFRSSVDGKVYREFQLDINQNSPIPARYETLDNFELFVSEFEFLCGYPFDGTGGGHSGCTTNNTATKVYGMDDGGNNFLVLDYTNNEGSGKRDLRVLVPNELFNDPDNVCGYYAPGSRPCTTYVTLFSQFGGDSDPANPDPLLQVAHGNNDGFEEWGVRVGVPTAITLQNITAEGGNAGLGFVIAGIGLLAVSTVLFLVLRKRQGVRG